MLLTDIASLIVVPPGPIPGSRMRHCERISDAAVLVEHGRIRWFGPADAAPPEASEHESVSAEGGVVVPGLIDPHTHIPFAGERSDEFVRRIRGETYLAIMEAGGGIRATTTAVRAASLEDLVAQNAPRLERMLACGVTTCECKSGYGLRPDDELKQLRAVCALREHTQIELVATYLGAHAVPVEFDGDPDGFVEAIAAPDLLRTIADESLAEFCDVFCDRGALNVEQSRRVLARAAAVGLRPKLHADELAQIGATRLAGEVQAISADHLECIDEDGIAALRAAGTVAVVLPGTSFFLGIPHCDARRLIAADLPVALSTDCNPGSSHIESLPLIMNIATCQLRMTPEEVLVACTANAAAAINRQQRLGSVQVGYDADLLVLDCPTLESWFYAPGRIRTRAVFKRGECVWSA